MAQAGYVYIVHGQGTNYIKIGKTTNILKRLKDLQHGVPFPLQLISAQLVRDMDEEEARLLKKYQCFQTRGEWCLLPQDALVEWPLDVLLQPFLAYKGPDEKVSKKRLVPTLLALLQEYGGMSIGSFYEALEVTSRRGGGRLRTCLFRLTKQGLITRSASGVYCLIDQHQFQESSVNAY